MPWKRGHTRRRTRESPGASASPLLEWVEVIVGSVVFVTILLTFVARIITVDGSSMSPTYENGDRVLATSLAGARGPGGTWSSW